MALKHRDRGGSRREHESLLDKQERDRNEKERKTDDGKKGWDSTKCFFRHLLLFDFDVCRRRKT